MTTFYKSGEWNVTCDVCSRKMKAASARKRWDGFIVCDGCYEERHPQDFVRARIDKISVPFQRPIPPYIYTNISYIIIYVDNDYIDRGYFEEL